MLIITWLKSAQKQVAKMKPGFIGSIVPKTAVKPISTFWQQKS
jgi:hypothetical protein